MPIGAYGNIGSTQVQYKDHESIYGETLSVAFGATDTIVSYTVPVNKTFRVSLVEFNGSNIGQYKIYVDSVLQASKTTYYGGPLSGDFPFISYKLIAGQVIELEIDNSTSINGTIGEFHGRIIGLLT